MSGGYFNDSRYVYYQVQQFADELEGEIETNDYTNDLSPEVVEILKKQIPEINRIAKIMKAIDYLYSADYGDNSFIEAIKEIEESK